MDLNYLQKFEEEESLIHCTTCSRDLKSRPLYHAPHRQLRYWIITTMIHLTISFLAISCIYTIHRIDSVIEPQTTTKDASSQPKTIDHNSHLIGTPLGSFLILFLMKLTKLLLIGCW